MALGATLIPYTARSVRRQSAPPPPARSNSTTIGALSFLVILLIASSIFYIATHVRVVNLGYKINQEAQRKETLFEENKRLSLEIAQLQSPTRIEKEAMEQHGLKLPEAHQIVYLSRWDEAAFAKAFPAKAEPSAIPEKKAKALEKPKTESATAALVKPAAAPAKGVPTQAQKAIALPAPRVAAAKPAKAPALPAPTVALKNPKAAPLVASSAAAKPAKPAATLAPVASIKPAKPAVPVAQAAVPKPAKPNLTAVPSAAEKPAKALAVAPQLAVKPAKAPVSAAKVKPPVPEARAADLPRKKSSEVIVATLIPAGSGKTTDSEKISPNKTAPTRRKENVPAVLLDPLP